MDEPKHILETMTTVITNPTISSAAPGFLVKDTLLVGRRPSSPGVIRGIVPGHGGDVYFVEHEYRNPKDPPNRDNIAVYGFWEFELNG